MKSGIAMGALLALAGLVGCGDGGASGTLRLTLNGEEASREGFPVGEGEDRIAFADGWSVEFEKVLVSIVDVRLAASDGDEAGVAVDPIVADLHLGTPEGWRLEGVPARRWDRFSYRFGAPTMDARRVNAVEDADLEAMVMGGHAFWIEGVARRDGQEVPFRWGLPVAVDNVRCVNGVDETDGLVIGEGGLSEAELTVHLDHLFFDSLASKEPGMRFEAMAAVAGEGPLTLEDLAAQSITDVRDAEGEPIEVEGAPLIYDPGDTPLEARDLRGFVLAAARTMGHFQGEGHCDYE